MKSKLTLFLIAVLIIVPLIFLGCKIQDTTELEERIAELEEKLAEEETELVEEEMPEVEEEAEEEAPADEEEVAEEEQVEEDILEEVVIDDIEKLDWKTYIDEDYNFTIQYPEVLGIERTFTNYHNLVDTWRYGAAEDSGGKPILSIVVYRVENENTYPRYFSAELRIGASNTTYDIENCLNYDQDSISNSIIETEIINGLTFNKLVIQDAATMQYVEGISYRIIHNDTCFAIEQLKTGSNYRDISNPKDIPDSDLNSYYDSIFEIIRTFKFIR